MNATTLNWLSAVALGAALFTMVWATFRWSLLGTLLGLAVGALAFWWVLRYNQRTEQKPPKAALERMAMSLAWRKGGRVSPSDLQSLGLDPQSALQMLEDMVARGLCQKEEGSYRFYR